MYKKVYQISNRRKQQLIFKDRLKLVTLLTTLFIFALSIPGISYFAIIITFFCLVIPPLSKILRESITIGRKKKTIPAKSFLVALIPLFLFSITYFTAVFGYNLVDETTAIRGVVLINISYIIGYNINFKQPFNYIYVYLALIAGGVVFVYLSVNSSSVSDIIDRSAPNFWKPGEDPVNGTVLDLYSMLGTGLIPFAFYGKNQLFNSKRYNLTAIACLIVGFMSLYTSILLQGRKAIISLFVILATTTLFKLKSVEKKDVRNFYVFLLIFLSLLLIVTFDTVAGAIFKNFEIFNRLQNEGLESGRYQAWAEILTAMPNHLFGGRAFPISESYAHNIWLDVFYDGGFLPMSLLLIFHILHIKPTLRIVFSNLPETIIILIICAMVPTLIGFQGEPVIQASLFYFATSCCFFGLVMRLSQITDLYDTVNEEPSGSEIEMEK